MIAGMSTAFSYLPLGFFLTLLLYYFSVITQRNIGVNAVIITTLTFVLASPDVINSEVPLSSMFNVTVLNMTIGAVLVGLCTLLSVLLLLQAPSLPRESTGLLLFLSFLLWPLFYGILYNPFNSNLIQDFVLFFACPFVALAVSKKVKAEEILATMISILVASFIIQFLLHRWVAEQVVVGSGFMYFADSTRNLAPIIMAPFVFSVFQKNAFDWKEFLIFALGAIVMVNATSRTTVVVFILMCLFLFATQFSLATLVRGLIASGFLAVVIFTLVPSESYFMWKVTSIVSADSLDITTRDSQSSMVRVYELLNIYSHGIENGTLLLGGGFGGGVSDKAFPFMHMLYGTTSYPDSWIDQGVFFKPHLSILNVFQKAGIVGLVLFIMFNALLIFKLLRLRKNRKLAFCFAVSLAICCFKLFSLRMGVYYSLSLAGALSILFTFNSCRKEIKPLAFTEEPG